METATPKIIRMGDGLVNPGAGEISRNGDSARLDGRSMLLLVCLAKHAGQVVGIDDLLDRVWAGVSVSPDSVYQAVTSLRRSLGDDPKQPKYIETLPRLGYRMVATVSSLEEQPIEEEGGSQGSKGEATPPAKVNAPRSEWRCKAGIL